MAKVRDSLRRQIEFHRGLILALLLNIPLIVFFLLLNLRGAQISGPAWLYTAGVLLGCYVLPLLFLVSLVAGLFGWFRKLASVLCGTLLTLYVFYLFLDSFVFRLHKFHIDLFWLSYIFGNYSGLGLPLSSTLLAFGALLGIAALEVGIFVLARRLPRPRWLGLSVTLILLLAFLGSQLIHIVAYERNDIRITSLTPRFPFYMPVTSHGNALRYGDLIPLAEASTAGDSLAEANKNAEYSTLHYPLREMRYDSSADKRFNLLFILLESWRYDCMDSTVTPVMDAFARRATVFTRHFSSGNSTTAGFFGIFYGLHPTYWPAVKANSSAIDNPVLIDRLESDGYAFGIYADSHFERHKIKDTMFRRIEVHEQFAGHRNDEKDADLTRQLTEFVREQTAAGRPFMGLAFYKSTHYSYDYPDSCTKFRPAHQMNLAFANNKKDPVIYKNDYRNSVAYVDSLLGGLLAELESLDLMDRTVVLISTDHGEEFNDNHANYWGHGSNFTRYQTQVPLILYIPGHAPGRVDHTTVHADIVPTLLEECFGCQNDERDYSNGRNLFIGKPEPRPMVIGSYVNHAFVTGDDVSAIFPIYTKRYKLDDIERAGAPPDPASLRVILEEIHRFYEDS